MHNLDPSDGIAVFTDGSADHRDRTGGWAWVALDAYEGFYSASGFVPNTTISRMELLGPIQALQTIEDAFGACDVLVYSDSEYVVKGVNDRARKRSKNISWWKLLDKAIEMHGYVQFHHVRGHADNLFNELADQLAGEARRTGLSGGSTR